DRFGDLPPVADFASTAGLGVRGVVDGHAVVVGRAALLDEWSLSLPEELARVGAEAEAAGHTAVAVAWDGKARGVLTVADAVKPTSAEAVARLRRLGLRSEEHTSELQSRENLVCRLLLEKKKRERNNTSRHYIHRQN